MLPLRKELLQDAQRFYEGFLTERAGDPTLRAELAAARGRLARITAEIGSPARAADQYQQAVALWDDLLGSHPDRPEYREELARTLLGRATVLMRPEGRRGEALADCRRALGLIEPLAGAAGAPVPPRQLLGQVLRNIAQIEFEQGHPREAIGTLGRVLEIEGRLAAEDPRSIAPRIVMARAHGLLGQVLSQQPEGLGPAMASCEQGIELLEAITREHPELADESYSLALDLSDLAYLQQMAGKLDSALKSDRRAIEILERLDRQYPGVLNYRGGLASTYNMMSDLHRRRLEPAESLAFAEKARPLLERLIAEHPKDTISRIDLSKSYNNIARMRQQSGQPAEALRSFRRAIDLLEGLPELDVRNSYNLACNLALCIPLIGASEGSQGVQDPEDPDQGRPAPPPVVRRPGDRRPAQGRPRRVPQWRRPPVRPRPRRDPRPGRFPGDRQGAREAGGGRSEVDQRPARGAGGIALAWGVNPRTNATIDPIASAFEPAERAALH